MRTSDDYQDQAIRCLRLAHALSFEPSKALLLEMAQTWAKLAEQAREREAKEAGSNQAPSRFP